ncbi:MAG: hypothetical protein IJR61_00110 [Clostridia bacterium]|nr:hypothetical protein [Clostridia bacterium]
MKKFTYAFLSLAIAALMLCLVIFPDRYISVAREGITLWAVSVLPSLFPFFFLTLLLTKMGALGNFAGAADRFTGKFFRCNGVSAYIFIMSALSGYPVGAKLISELYAAGKTDGYEATRMSCFCSTSGPLFVMGTVGVNMFGNKLCGAIMLACHLISAVICGKIFYKYGAFNKMRTTLKHSDNTDNILYECIYSSVISIICVGRFICVFYLLARVLSDFGALYLPTALLKLIFARTGCSDTAANGFMLGLIECTNGCNILAEMPCAFTAALACGVISFGGLSVAFQSAIYLIKAKVNMKIFFLSKTLQMIISFILCFAVLYLAKIF